MLEGAKFKGQFGRTYHGGMVEGVVSSSMKNGPIDIESKTKYYNRCRYISFEKPGLSLTFDFNCSSSKNEFDSESKKSSENSIKAPNRKRINQNSYYSFIKCKL
jgi:hypothetical protein